MTRPIRGLPNFIGFGVVALLVGLTARAQAQSDPLAGQDRFPEFRNLSGLGGGGYGTDARGYPSLAGPVALSTPVAHVLGHGHFYFTAERTSLVDRPELSSTLTNGTLCVTYGTTVSNLNIALTDMFINAEGKQVFNLQVQFIPSDTSRLVGSVGAQDFIWGGGGSSGLGVSGDMKSSRSVFGVLTYRLTDVHPVYVSAGIGSRRFEPGFASISWQALDPLRVYTEYDGFGFNAGLVTAVRVGHGRSSTELGIRLGVVQQRWITLGGTLGI